MKGDRALLRMAPGVFLGKFFGVFPGDERIDMEEDPKK